MDSLKDLNITLGDPQVKYSTFRNKFNLTSTSSCYFVCTFMKKDKRFGIVYDKNNNNVNVRNTQYSEDYPLYQNANGDYYIILKSGKKKGKIQCRETSKTGEMDTLFKNLNVFGSNLKREYLYLKNLSVL
jgi:hypothetical protein